MRLPKRGPLLIVPLAVLALFAQVLVSGVFVVAVVAKLRDGGAALAATVAQLLPTRAPARSISWVVIGAELVAAGLVWWPAPRLGLGVAAVLVLGYAAVAFQQAGRATRVHCRCFGGSGSVLGIATGVRNVVIAGVALAGAAAAGSSGALPPAGAAVTVLGAAACGAVVVFLDDLTDLVRT